MRRLVRGALTMWALFALSSGSARGGNVISVTFDEPQLVDNDAIWQFYNGGTTYLGIGGGPDLGVSFSLNARVRTQDVLVGDYTPPGYMELKSDTAREGEGISTTMDVQGGFTSGLLFSFATIDAQAEVKVYSGLDGTGTLLADVILPITSPMNGPGVFDPGGVTFSGVAESVIFAGGNKQLAIDDIFFTVPEPPAWSLLAIGGMLCAAACRSRWTKRASRRREPA